MAKRNIQVGLIIEGLKESPNVGAGAFESMFCEATQNIDYDGLAKKIQEYARDGHKASAGIHYKDRTSTLKNNTYAQYDGGGDQIEVGTVSSQITDSKGQPYDEFVMNGHGSWDGDPFLDEAVVACESIIQKDYQEQLDRVIEQQNRSGDSLWIVGGVITRVVGSIWGSVKRIFR